MINQWLAIFFTLQQNPNDSVNINQHQEEEKEAEIQHKDIDESKSDESTRYEETQPKKGFWSRLFGS